MPAAVRVVALAAMSLLVSAAPPGLESGVLKELNRARTDPAGFAGDLRAFRRQFRPDGRYRTPGDPVLTRTREGVAAVDEAIRALERQAPVGLVAPSPFLSEAARDHVEEQGPRGTIGHESANGAHAGDRVVARGGGRYVAEIIAYGNDDPRAVVAQLIVDDGVPGRGHRRILYDPSSRFAGVACGPHAVYRIMCTIDFSRRERGEPA